MDTALKRQEKQEKELYDLKSVKPLEVPVVTQRVRNLTRIHEDAGSQSLALLSGFRIQHCRKLWQGWAQILHGCGCGVDRQLQLQLDPYPGRRKKWE